MTNITRLILLIVAALLLSASGPARFETGPMPQDAGPTPTPPPDWWVEPAEHEPLRPGALLSGRSTAWRCTRYAGAVMQGSWPDPRLTPSLVLAVAARESGCDHLASDGQFHGLMAVIEADWTTDGRALLNPRANVRWGTWILHLALEHPAAAGDLRTALAIYNCGYARLVEGRCDGLRGFAYADDILNVWEPLVREALLDYAETVSDRGIPYLQQQADWIAAAHAAGG